MAFRDALNRIGRFDSLRGEECSKYEFSAKRHHGPSDDKLFAFIEVADRGAHLVKAAMTNLKPK